MGRSGSPRPPAPDAGLPVSGAVAVALGAGVGGGAVDVLTGPGLRAIFAVSFVVGCALAAAFVRRRGLLAAVVLPPLAYIVIAAAAAVFQHEAPGPGSWLVREAFELMTALMTGAPVLVAATLSALVVALVRLAAFHGAAPAIRHLPRG